MDCIWTVYVGPAGVLAVPVEQTVVRTAPRSPINHTARTTGRPLSALMRVSMLVLLGLVLAFYSPLKHNFQVGQINPLIALLATWGYWRSSGVGIAMAAWVKMSPAILLAPFVLQKRWATLGSTAVMSLVLLLLSLPFLGWSGVVSFFTEVLPQLGKGSYNGMSVPLNLNANRSSGASTDPR